MSETHMDKAARETARELCEKATAGPWGIGRAPRGRVFVDGPSTNPSIPSPDVVCSPDLSDRFVEQDNDNMRFIAAARTLLPQALDALDAADAEIERLKKHVLDVFTINERLLARKHDADSDNARLQSRVAELEAALGTAIKVADEARREWDAAPNGMKAGKLLIAMSDASLKYRADITAMHKALPAPPVGDR